MKTIFKVNLESWSDIRTVAVMFTEVYSITLALLQQRATRQIKQELAIWITQVLVVH